MDWHTRYLQQAGWTRNLRNYLLDMAGLSSARHILEVGCGTGALLGEFATSASLHGLDLDGAALAECRMHAPHTLLTLGNGLALPYGDGSFDIVYCHYFLLWVKDPLQAVREMKRVVQQNGHVLALAEPDYASRVDKPDSLQPLGQWQTEALRRQGADPTFGARLAETFFQAGIKIRETGTIDSPRQAATVPDQELEWAVLESDLAGTVAEVEIQKMKRLDAQAWKQGERVLHVPTYYAWGQTQ